MAVKSALLEVLEKNRGSVVSGQALADTLGVSRAAVWKAVRQLGEEGHKIEAATNKGYCLRADSDVITPQSVRLFLEKDYQEYPVLVHSALPSTNTTLKQLATEGAAHGTIVIADAQSGGRGRMGRSFYSPMGTGVYMSLLLRPKGTAADYLVLTAAVAVAVCRVIERFTKEKAQIKWVNDIFIRGKKVCGILTEGISDFESGMVESIIVGVGVNVSTDAAAVPLALRQIIGSLGVSGASRSRLVGEIANEIFHMQEHLPERAFLDEYRSRSLVLGERISFVHNGTTREGTAADINEDGHLLVHMQDGGRVALKSGEVSIRRLEHAEKGNA